MNPQVNKSFQTVSGQTVPFEDETKLRQSSQQAEETCSSASLDGHGSDMIHKPGSAIVESSEHPTKPYLPIHIPGYEIVSELGHGGMGVVYLARQIRLNRLVAVKMIRAIDYDRSQAQERFFKEAELIARLQHPGIVHIYEFGVHDENDFFVLEYIRGGSLD